MSINPLDMVDGVIALSLTNPNPKAARLKDGPRYRIEFEVDEDTFVLFMNARELGGMVLECHATVAALNEPESKKPKRPEAGPLAQWAATRCKDPAFRSFLAEQMGQSCDTEDEARECILAVCGIESRRELDTNTDARALFDDVVRRPFEQWAQGAPAEAGARVDGGARAHGVGPAQ